MLPESTGLVEGIINFITHVSLLLLVFKASKALGNCKPQLLAKIELDMWNALLMIATGRSSAYTAVHNFLVTVPWQTLNAVSKTDHDFFMPGIIQLFYSFLGGSLVD